jgi:hypothetical protein
MVVQWRVEDIPSLADPFPSLNSRFSRVRDRTRDNQFQPPPSTAIDIGRKHDFIVDYAWVLLATRIACIVDFRIKNNSAVFAGSTPIHLTFGDET